MNEETAQKVIYLKNDIDRTREQIKRLNNHSFGFGTSCYDIDNTLRPIAKTFLNSKLEVLLNELENLK